MNWLLLRGLARETRHWGNFPNIIQKTLKSKKVIALDLPGSGIENQREVPLSIAEMVQDVRTRFLAQAQPGEEWGVLSISMGGMLALQWCAEFPTDFTRAVLINSSAKKICSIFERLNPAAFQTITKALFNKSALKREELILKATSSFHQDNQTLAQEWSNYSETHPVAPKNLMRQLWAAAQFTPPEKIENTRLLFINSADDRFVSPISSYKLSKFYHSTLKTHPTGGHDLALDDPEWIAKTVLDWCSETSLSEPVQQHSEML